MLREAPVVVRYQKPGLLGVLALFLKWRQILFLASVSILMGGLLGIWFREFPLYMISAFIGGLYMVRFADDARAIARSADRALIVARLERSAFKYDPADRSWIPALPVLLRWPDTKVRLSDLGGTSGRLELTGPRSYLRRLTRGLDAPLE